MDEESNFIDQAATQVNTMIGDLAGSAMPVVLAAVGVGLAFFGIQFVVKRAKKAVSN